MKESEYPCDFIIILDETTQRKYHINEQLTIIQHLWEVEYFKKGEDRFEFISFGDQINVIQSLTQIKNNK